MINRTHHIVIVLLVVVVVVVVVASGFEFVQSFVVEQKKSSNVDWEEQIPSSSYLSS